MEETWQLRVRLGVQRLGKLEAELKKILDEGRRRKMYGSCVSQGK